MVHDDTHFYQLISMIYLHRSLVDNGNQQSCILIEKGKFRKWVNRFCAIQCSLNGPRKIRRIWSRCQNGRPATHGETYSEAVKNGQKVLELLVESTTQDGEPLPAPKVHAA
jgi:hypothetical protein